FLLWWMLQSEDTPWVPAGLAASVVMLVAASARQVLMRRTLRRHILAQEKHGRHRESHLRSSPKRRNFHSITIQTEAFRTLANRALDCLDSALKVYPDARELDQSSGAVREFIMSSRVAHWVELAERAAFKGYYRRAIDCYRDALFYLTRDNLDQNREAAAEQITREIDLLRARLETQKAGHPVVEASVTVKKTRRKKKEP